MPPSPNFYHLGGIVRRRWSWMPTWFYLLIVLLLAQGCLLVTFMIGAIATVSLSQVSILSVGFDTTTTSSFTVALIVNFAPLFLLIALALWITEGRGLRSIGMQAHKALFYYGRGLLVGMILFGSVALVMSLLGHTAMEAPVQWTSLAGACLILIGWIIQGAAEEVLTRGFLLQIFGRITNSGVGILVSSAFFTFMHIDNQSFSIIAMINLMLFSVFAALYTLHERGLWGVFAIHSIWNWAQGNLFGFQVSGHEIEASVILDLKETGPDMLTGGAYGPEGGLIVSIIFIIAIIVIGKQKLSSKDQIKSQVSS